MTSKTIPIHTSDRIAYKKCRRAWNWGSRIRRNLVPNKPAMPLGFGSAIHAAFEVYYEPLTWHIVRYNPEQRKVIVTLAIQAFVDYMEDMKQKIKLRTGQEVLAEHLEVEYTEHMALGLGMLENYFKWAPARDKFTVIAVEQKFEVLLFTLPDGTDVVYRGRLDMLVQDDDGKYWIWDHKTAARFEEDTFFLTLDEQVSSYCWALALIKGIKIEGVVYNEVYKGVPAKPARLSSPRKGLIFSVNKAQDTTYELYLEALREAEQPIEPYEDILNYFKNNAPQYVRRTTVYRTEKEQIALGLQIVAEAREMVDPEIAIYPNPNRFSCKWCSYRDPCVAQSEGSDAEWILKQYFHTDENKIIIEDEKEQEDVEDRSGSFFFS